MSVPVESQILSFDGVPTRAGSLYYIALRTVDTETDTNRVFDFAGFRLACQP
jgi:hypothetical protein